MFLLSLIWLQMDLVLTAATSSCVLFLIIVRAIGLL